MKKSNVFLQLIFLSLALFLSEVLQAQLTQFQQLIQVNNTVNTNRNQEIPTAIEIINNQGNMEVFIGGSLSAGTNNSQDIIMVRTDANGNVLNTTIHGNANRNLGQSLCLGANANELLLGGLTVQNNRNRPAIWTYNLGTNTFAANMNFYPYNGEAMIRSIELDNNGIELLSTGSSDITAVGEQAFHFARYNNTLATNSRIVVDPVNGARRYGNSIFQDPANGDVSIVGYNVGNGQEGFYCRIDNSNNTQDYTEFSINGANGNCKIVLRDIVRIPNSNQFLAVGLTQGCTGVNSLGNNDAIIIRIDDMGNVLFSQIVGTGTRDEFFGIEMSPTNNDRYYLCGRTNHSDGHGNSDIFLAAYNLTTPLAAEGIELGNIRLFGGPNDDLLTGTHDMLNTTTNTVGGDLAVVAGITNDGQSDHNIILISAILDPGVSNECEEIVEFQSLAHQVLDNDLNVTVVSNTNDNNQTHNLIANNFIDSRFCSLSCNISVDAGCIDGSLYSTANNGTGPYTYLWSNSATTQNILNVAPGTYTVTITDASGATTTCNASFNTIPLQAQYVTTDATCGQCDGTISITNVNNGTAPYMYQLNGNAPTTNPNFTGLCPGLHKVVITDNNYCRIQYDIIVNAAPACWQQTTQNNFMQDWGNDIETDLAGNVYGVGTFTENAEFECNGNIIPVGMGNGNRGMFLVKYDPCGDPLWVASTGNATTGEWATANTITLSEDSQRVFVAGEYRGQFLDFIDGQGNTFNVTNYSRGMAYCAAYDVNTGALIWIIDLWNTPGLSVADFKPTGISLNDTAVFVAGYSNFLGGSGLLSWFLKIDRSLVSIPYEGFFPDKDCYVEDLEIQDNGNFVLVGRYIGQIGTGFGGSPYPISSGSGGIFFDGFVTGVSDIGTGFLQNWIHVLKADGGNGELYDVAIDGDEIYTTGTVENYTVNSFRHTGTSVSVPAIFNNKAIVTRLTPNGNFGINSWLSYSDPNREMEGKGIDVSGLNLVMNGNIQNPGSVQFYYANSSGIPGSANGPFAISNSSDNIYVAHSLTNSSFQSIIASDGGGNQNAEAIASDGIFAYSTGDYTMDINVIPGPIDGFVPPNQKAFFLRNTASIPGVPFQRKKAETEFPNELEMNSDQLQAYPNPVKGQLHILSPKSQRIAIYNLQGKLMQEGFVRANEKQQIDVSAYAKGIYLLRTESNEMMKIIVQ